MSDIPTVSYWRGQRVDGLSKEELIAALEELGNLYNQALGSRARQWRRISHMAGLDEDGGILPPDPLPISREPVTWWRNRKW